jgi:hypothetical protein
MVFPYLKDLIVIKEILHIVLVYLLWCFGIQFLVLNNPKKEGYLLPLNSGGETLHFSIDVKGGTEIGIMMIGGA